MINVGITLTDETIETIAMRAAEIALAKLTATRETPYLTVPEAAEYLCAKPQRVYDLLSTGRLTRHKDGTRVLISRVELEGYLSG
jgi:excisionase family DNA binding protein